MNEIVKNKIKTIQEPYLLDGYPRTIFQAEFLEKFAAIGLVIYLEVSDETIINRILERGKTSNRADDQSIEIINKRILHFKEETFPLIDFYKNKGILSIIDGEKEIKEVFETLNFILT